MKSDANVLLMGLRGSGKTSVGALLAPSMGRPFEDTDNLAAESLGEASVADAWRAHGEPAFRQAERAALERLLAQRGLVIALGGGTPTAPGASELIDIARGERSAVTVYLRFPPRVLRSRLEQAGGAGPDRPSLTGADPLEEIEAVHAQRDPLYRSLADLVIENDAPAESLAREIAQRLDEL